MYALPVRSVGALGDLAAKEKLRAAIEKKKKELARKKSDDDEAEAEGSIGVLPILAVGGIAVLAGVWWMKRNKKG